MLAWLHSDMAAAVESINFQCVTKARTTFRVLKLFQQQRRCCTIINQTERSFEQWHLRLVLLAHLNEGQEHRHGLGQDVLPLFANGVEQRLRRGHRRHEVLEDVELDANWKLKVFTLEKGLDSAEVANILASNPAAPGSILGIPKNFSLDVAESYCRHCLEQWSEAW